MSNELFEEVVKLSGLPKEIISKELRQILYEMNVPVEKVTESQLRQAMAKYLQNIADLCK